MGKARKAIKISAPSGSATLTARRLRDATTIKEITEAYCLALFMPCWMYPSFRQRVSDEFNKLPMPVDKPVILPAPTFIAPPVRQPAPIVVITRPLPPQAATREPDRTSRVTGSGLSGGAPSAPSTSSGRSRVITVAPSVKAGGVVE